MKLKTKLVTSVILACVVQAQATSIAIKWEKDTDTSMRLRLDGVGLTFGIANPLRFDLTSAAGWKVFDLGVHGGLVHGDQVLSGITATLNFKGMFEPENAPWIAYDDFQPFNTIGPIVSSEAWFPLDLGISGIGQLSITSRPSRDPSSWVWNAIFEAEHRQVPEAGGLVCLALGLLGLCAFARIPRLGGGNGGND